MLHGINTDIYGIKSIKMRHELTLQELIEKIKLKMDPYILLESLDLEFEELVDYLRDAIEDNYESLLEEIEDEDE